MKVNKYLKRVKQSLDSYYCQFEGVNILTVSEAPESSPFIFIVKEAIHPDFLCVSFASDYTFTKEAANLTLLINEIQPVVVMENFFINQVGQMYFGDSADDIFQLELDLPLDEIEPQSKEFH